MAAITGRQAAGVEGIGTVTGNGAPPDGRRRNEILDTASRLFASAGLRTSLQEIADECGIKAGSLYHHFESKEAIVVELLERYHADLDGIAEAAASQPQDPGLGAPEDQILELGTAIARCAVRHSAAVQFTFYEPRARASHELTQLSGREPDAIESAMVQALRRCADSGFIRPGIDLEVLADRICQTMLQVGLGLFHRYTAVDRVSGLLCRIMLHGLSAGPAEDADLDGSAAMLAVGQVIRQWDDPAQAAEGGRTALIRRAARAEFGRRGYEATTVRDIAATAGLSTGTVYRAIRSKEELLDAIMDSFARKVMAGWNAVLGSSSTAVEKLDALAWLHINVLEKFSDEFKIQLAWLRQSPPDVPSTVWAFPAAARQLRGLLASGSRTRQLRVEGPSTELTTRCVIDLTWVPERIVRDQGKRAALILARDTVLRGIAALGVPGEPG